MNVPQLVSIFVAHCIFDWWLQTQWMARNKSKDWLALSAHVLVYTLGLMLVPRIDGNHIALLGLWRWALLNGVLHFATDAITSRISSHYFAKGGAGSKGFWNTIGTDQCIHMVTLVGTYWWMIGVSNG